MQHILPKINFIMCVEANVTIKEHIFRNLDEVTEMKVFIKKVKSTIDRDGLESR